MVQAGDEEGVSVKRAVAMLRALRLRDPDRYKAAIERLQSELRRLGA